MTNKKQPVWFNQNVANLELKKMDIANQLLVLANESAELTIDGREVNGFKVSWKIIFYKDYHAEGKIYFQKIDFWNAFGLSEEDKNENENGLIMGAFPYSKMKQGKFIRFGNYLNIPCLGTGKNEDPNLSIYITDNMKEYAKRLLETKELKYKCPKCDTVGIIKGGQKGRFGGFFNFICRECGYEDNILLQQELIDLDDYDDNAKLAVKIAGLSLLK